MALQPQQSTPLPPLSGNHRPNPVLVIAHHFTSYTLTQHHLVETEPPFSGSINLQVIHDLSKIILSIRSGSDNFVKESQLLRKELDLDAVNALLQSHGAPFQILRYLSVEISR